MLFEGDIDGEMVMWCKLVVGNWKMNGSLVVLVELDGIVIVVVVYVGVNVVIVVLVMLIVFVVVWVLGLLIGVEDVYLVVSGVYIGCIFVVMVWEVGVWFLIVGYSEWCVD